MDLVHLLVLHDKKYIMNAVGIYIYYISSSKNKVSDIKTPLAQNQSGSIQIFPDKIRKCIKSSVTVEPRTKDVNFNVSLSSCKTLSIS